MRNISQTFELKNSSKKSDKENSILFHQIKDRLPQPNPILAQQLQFSNVNSLLPLKKNYLETNEQDIKYTTNIQQQEQECVTLKPTTLQTYVKQYKLIYQKYSPHQTTSLYATLLYQTGDILDSSQYFQSDEEIKFDSLFESGNLFQVFKKSDKEYILLLQNDINTKGYNQWFYFSISNKCSYINNIRIHIININKDMNFYRQGMKILINECNYWRKDSLGLIFKKNNILRNDNSYYYTLSFNYTFIEQGTVYFASNYPYTYSNLQQFIQNNYPKNQNIMKIKTIMTSSAGNDIQIITITNNNNEQQKQGLLFIGRQHPGEPQSSFLIEGIIHTLLSKETEELRNKFVIKIIPMLNVDGVVHGNQRCGLKGYDLNRKWGSNQDDLLIQIEKYIKEFNQNYPLQLVLDIHGHSRKHFGFFYGQNCCEFINEICQSDKRFSLQNSRFMKNNKYLNHTARVYLSNLLNMSKIYTLEISYFGYKDENQIIDFSLNDLRQMGKELITVLQKQNSCLLTQSIILEDQLSEMSLSESEVSEDEINQNEIKEQLSQPLKEKNQNSEQPYQRSYSFKSRQLKSSQSRNRAKSQSIQNTIKYQQFTYNFVDNSFNNFCSKNDSFEPQTMFIPLQKPKQSEYSVQPIVIMPSHSLKHQFLWQNRIRQQNLKEKLQQQKDMKVYLEFREYVNHKNAPYKQVVPKYSFNDTDLFKRAQAKKQQLIINP